MDVAQRTTSQQDPKLLSGAIAAVPAYHALMGDVRAIAGEAVFISLVKRLGSAQTDIEKICQAQPGMICWSLNKSVDNPYHRIQIAKRLASRISPEANSEPVDPDKAALFRRTGFLDLTGIISVAETEEMGAFFSSRMQFEPDGPIFNNLIEDVVTAPHALRLATHPDILSVVADHLGGAPTIVDMSAWWSDPTPNDDYGAHIFHRDKDDFRACKLFLYLTDVATDDGPHVFARNTHDPEFIKTTLAAQGLSPDLLDQFFSGNGRPLATHIPKIFAAQISEILGPVGACFLENTYGFHRGKTPKRNRRGIFQVAYGTTAYPIRLERLAPVKLGKLPPDCRDTPMTRQATRLLFV